MTEPAFKFCKLIDAEGSPFNWARLNNLTTLPCAQVETIYQCAHSSTRQLASRRVGVVSPDGSCFAFSFFPEYRNVWEPMIKDLHRPEDYPLALALGLTEDIRRGERERYMIDAADLTPQAVLQLVVCGVVRHWHERNQPTNRWTIYSKRENVSHWAAALLSMTSAETVIIALGDPDSGRPHEHILTID